MTAAQFDAILDRRLALTRQVLASKGAEYASDTDRLHNFKAASMLTGNDPRRVMLGMLVKHWVSVQDLVRRIESYGQYPTPAVIDEKVGDAINYLVLLEAVFREHAE